MKDQGFDEESFDDESTEPRFTYGAGQIGCLYDNGPHEAETLAEAVEALAEDFDHYFELLSEEESPEVAEEESQAMRSDLLARGIFYFNHPKLAGAHYCEVTDHGER